MIKRILLALDRDPDTPLAMRYAIKLAKKHKASLTGLAIVDTKNIQEFVGDGGISTIYYTNELRKEMSEESREQAGVLLDRFDKMVREANVKHATKMVEGVPYQRIIEDMKYHDLLIIGRESHFFYNRPEQETNTLADIVKNSTAPTLVVTESYYEPINKVIIAHDGSTASARSIQWFIHLEPYGKDVEIHLVNICDDTKDAEKEKANLKLRLVKDYLRAHNYENIHLQVVNRNKSNADSIIDYLREEGGHVVVLGAHAVSAIRRLTFGSTTHDMVQGSPVPLFLSH